MSADAPLPPILDTNELLRTLTSIGLTFTPDADDGGSSIIGYELWRDEGIAGSPYSMIYNGTGKPEQIQYVAMDLTTGLSYRFKLYSRNAIYRSAQSNIEVVLIGTVPGKPSKPAYVSSSVALTNIKVSWTAPSYTGGSAITSYNLWIDDGAGNWPATPITHSTLSNLAYTFTGLTVGTTYAIKVQTVNAVGASEDSDVSFYVCAQVPSAPSVPLLESSSKSSITIAWNAIAPINNGGSSVTGYRVYMNDLLSDRWELVYDGSSFPSTLTFHKTGLTAGRSYRFRITALNTVGESSPSTADQFIAADYPSAPS